ncbi:MAG: DNA cytosine methyltransferase [Polymorphobacter sp.]
MNKRTFFEFFAGGGMARAGLGDGWQCAFANDFDPMKGSVYEKNWGGDHLKIADINEVSASDLPGVADLIWASFPCQDLSLAGNAEGLGTASEQTRSGAFWALWRIVEALESQKRSPSIIVLENVYGILTAKEGREFATVARCLSLAGYKFGSILLDSVYFVPQSRPRIFIVGVRSDLTLPAHLVSDRQCTKWHPPAMEQAINRLNEVDYENWFWLTPPIPKTDRPKLATLIDSDPVGVRWHVSDETSALIGMMSDTNIAKLNAMLATGKREVATLYKRTRRDEFGAKVQRAELRVDGIAGCLRTPGGGSSRQYVVVTEHGQIRSRLLSPREAARLMGLPDSYILPPRYNDAYHVAGDGLVVPAVSYLAHHVIEAVLDFNDSRGVSIAAE